MDFRTYHNLTLSEIGFGCYGLSGAYGSIDLESYKRTFLRAYELGVNFFDTAEGYGNAEQFLGDIVKPFRNEIHIATKVGVKDGFKPNLSLEYIQTACENSLKVLQTDYLDLYQIHFDDPTTPVEETINALELLVRQGKIRYYGLGHLPLPRIQAYIESGDPFSMLTELSPVARTALNDILPVCQALGVGVIAFSVTGRGLLTGKINAETTFEANDIRNMDPLFQHESFRSGLRVEKKLSEIGKRYGKTSAQVAIAWVLAQPGVICALTGPSTIPHLEENLGSSGWNFTNDDYRDLDIFLAEESDRLLEAQRATIGQLLSLEITDKPQQAFTDLIYVVETAVTLNLVAENEIMPLFMELFGLRENLDQNAVVALERIRKRLKETIPI
jgi:aryl-alcohol dehydrogenase-like predicted oxidoreductase